ncbi:SHOCT domain-containing protein [Shewanella zhangzhouensis]|uniref:SHOCT domain-containing protein n=1 Tax=Shewanella zhangzhouensis TaxID=2864213 RepID=UPI001C656B3D|nr:SHOCT domain-containing protein [Shewanella zhangzhouensis]QYK06883.1 SHOCT domain-containing protein [Shewanella zhangzhouensis]
MKIEGKSQTKDSKYNATIGFIVSIGMLLVVFMAIDFSTMPAFGKVFMILWIFVVAAQGYQAYRNSIFSNNSLHQKVTDHNLVLKGEAGSALSRPKNDHADRLVKVEQLYNDGLLSREEYLAKRKDILDGDWGS